MITENLPLFITALNTGITIVLIVYWFSLYKKGKLIDNELENKEKQAEKILERAEKKALKKIEKTELFTKDIEREAREAIREALKDLKELNSLYYKKILEEYQERHKKALITLQQKNSEVISNFANSLINDTKEVKEEALSSLEEAVKQSQKEINEYKQKIKEKFRQELFSRIDEIILSVLSKNISPEEHLQIVQDAVEEAKRQGFFK